MLPREMCHPFHLLPTLRKGSFEVGHAWAAEGREAGSLRSRLATNSLASGLTFAHPFLL